MKWALEHSSKPFSINTIPRCLFKRLLSLKEAVHQYCPKAAKTSLVSSEKDSSTQEMCFMVWWVDISNSFWKLQLSRFLGQRGKGSSKLMSASGPKASTSQSVRVCQCPWQGWTTSLWGHLMEQSVQPWQRSPWTSAQLRTCLMQGQG